MDAAVIVTYRCNSRCLMCGTWNHPTRLEDEIGLEIIGRLPNRLGRCNITGGEPMLRGDIDEIVGVLSDKAQRVELSTNGYLTRRIVSLARNYPRLTVRVSLEGLPKANEKIRGTPDGFERALRTVLELKRLGLKDLGIATVVQDGNAKDLMDLFTLADGLGIQFAQAVPHNSFYFHKFDNAIREQEMTSAALLALMQALLLSKKPKNWFRAYLNRGLLKRLQGQTRPLPCTAGTDIFFLDPFGEIYPCNGVDWSMGNLKDAQFNEIWRGPDAERVRKDVERCSANCWMTGTAVPALKRHPLTTSTWVVANKTRAHLGLPLEAG